MDYLKYLNDKTKFETDKNDCWTFCQQIFKNEQNKELPNHPYLLSNEHSAAFLLENLKYRFIDKPKAGALIYYKNGDIHHAGYALSDKKMIHKTIKGVKVDTIPENVIILEIL